jgi:predicted RNA binding protein with dsRBD fold (UPF0201 family)
MTGQDILGYFIIGFVLFVSFYTYRDNYESFQLKCIVSTVDGNKYCVREREKIEQAADLLATISKKCKDLVAYTVAKYPDNKSVQRLHQNFNPQTIMETLPTSTYTAYSENKGEKVAFCLNKQKQDNDNLIDESTLTFVAIHELSHVMTKSIGHKSEFWSNFKFLLECAKESGIHIPVDYKEKPQEYCGMKIHDNPYYDA